MSRLVRAFSVREIRSAVCWLYFFRSSLYIGEGRRGSSRHTIRVISDRPVHSARAQTEYKAEHPRVHIYALVPDVEVL